MKAPHFDDLYDKNLLILYESEGRKIRMMRDEKRALILGYEIFLTRSEYLILHRLSKSESPISRESFANDHGLTYSSIPVHISNINKKAFPITGRKLIIGNRCGEYSINEHV